MEPFSRKYDLKKKVQKILTSNISEIYGPIILPKDLDRELSKIYLYKELWSVTSGIVGHTKLIFFIFQFFHQKTNQQNELKTLQIKAIYTLHYHDFSPFDQNLTVKFVSYQL